MLDFIRAERNDEIRCITFAQEFVISTTRNILKSKSDQFESIRPSNK